MKENNTPIIINESLCSGCGRCVFVCAMGVIEMRDRTGDKNTKTAVVAKPEYCMYCEACVIDCKMGAISLNPQHGSLNIDMISEMILKKKKKEKEKKNRFQFWKK